MTDVSTNPIYSYRATEELGVDSWAMLVQATSTNGTAKIPEWESEYKNATNLPLPGAWRSAKSVILAAKRWGIRTTDIDSGEARGKSAVEKEIQAVRGEGGSGAGMSPSEKLKHILRTAVKFAKKHSLDFDYHLGVVR